MKNFKIHYSFIFDFFWFSILISFKNQFDFFYL